MKDPLRDHLLIVVVAAVVLFFNLGASRLWDRDEPRNAGCAAEMMARSDWVVPTFNDELRQQKPVLLYWLIMSAYGLFGQTEFAARFWSAALAIGTVIATYGIARRLIGPLAGLLAGTILCTNLMFDVTARAATPDSVLIFCGTVALWLYVMGTFAPRNQQDLGADTLKLRVPDSWFPQNYLIVIAMYAMLGLGVLAKGPVGFLLPMAIIGMFGLIQRLPKKPASPIKADSLIQKLFQFGSTCAAPFHPTHFLKTLWSMRPLTAAVVVLLVAAPWYVLVDARTEGEFTRLFFLGEHFGRATTAMESHRGGLWFYPLTILVGFFPWSMFWGPLVVMLFVKRRIAGRLSVAECFAICWIAIQVGAFSIAQTKLPSYVTPCYPALAILTANFLAIWVASESSLSWKWMYAAYSGLILGGLLLAAGLAVAASLYFPDQIWLLTIGLIPIVGGGLAIWQLTRRNKQRVLVTTVATSFLLCLALFGFGTVAVNSVQDNQSVLRHVVAANEGQVIASYRSLESSWVYYGKKPIYECSIPQDTVDERSATETLSRHHWWHPKPRISPEAMLRLHPSVLFITTDEHYPELKKRLPEEFGILQKADYFLRDREVVLVGRKKTNSDSRTLADRKYSAQSSAPLESSAAILTR
jgi:4-amino-4-deoxy-L-arabinose transferase-like glycosyltransferase